MPRRISIEPHLSIDELENRYRQSKDAIASGGAKPIARTHYQTIWLLASGKTTSEVSSVTGYGLSWIYELVRSYNRFGPQMLGDRRKNNTGAEPLLNDVQLAQLWQVLQSKPGDGGLWNGPLICGMDE
jgi:transposase